MRLETIAKMGVAVATHRSLPEVLRSVVGGLAEHPEVALARVWMTGGAGDQFGLHLAASDGRSRVDDHRWIETAGSFAFMRIGDRKVGRVAEDRTPVLLGMEEGRTSWLRDPHWAEAEGIQCFAGHPLLFRDRVLGVLAVFSRQMLNDAQVRFLQILADQAATAIANANAFEENERLSRQLSVENDALRDRLDENTRWLASGVAHEVNSPLGAIVSSSGLLVQYADRLTKSPERIAEVGRSIERAARRIGDTVQRLSRFAELERCEFRSLSPEASLDSAVAMVDGSLLEGVTFTRSYAGLPAFRGHGRALNQAYLSVLTNALEAVGPGGHIELVTEYDPEWLRIAIVDDGCGLPQEHGDRLFELGFTTKTNRVGRGVGLALARHVVEQHGGSITIERRDDRTHVTLCLPNEGLPTDPLT